METSKTRRAAVAIFGSAAVAAFTELRPALASGGNKTKTGTGGGPTCRNEGGNCSGNQTCCSGLVCTPTGNGNSKTCQAEEPVCDGGSDCPNGCVCTGGTCDPQYPDVTCIAVAYNRFASECNTKYGRRKRVNCKQFPNKSGRRRCQRRNNRLRARLTTCRTEAESLAIAYCTVN